MDNRNKQTAPEYPDCIKRALCKGKGSIGVAKRERRHSEFGLDALVVVEVDIAVNHGIGFA